MKRNYLRLSLQIVSPSLLWSCQQELLQTEQDYSQKSQQFTIQQLLRSQLEKKDPQLVSKVDRLQGKKASGNARIYTDAENGFSVDTEKAIYLEDANGNKTYTFKIGRNRASSGFLENLILKQITASEYSAYIVKYDQTAVENLGSIAQSDLKNHITFTPLGTKTGAEVFGKYDANSSCNVMMPYASNWVYVGGTMCYENAHDYAHIGDCVYKNDPAKAPTQGYATYEVSYGLVDICGSGGSSGGVGTMPTGGGTTPVGGGGGGSIFIDVTDPCNILKANLQIAKQLINITDVKTQNNTMIQTIVTDPSEKAFYFGKNLAGVYKVSPIIGGGTTSVNVTLSNSQFNPEGLVHNHNKLDGYTNFSPEDINKLHYFHSGYSTLNHSFANGADGSMYVMTIEDQDAYDAFVTKYPDSVFDFNADWKEGTDIRTEEDFLLDYFKKLGKTSDEANDLAFGYLVGKYNMGIMVSKKGADGNFHPIQVEKVESIDPLSGQTIVSYQKINPCNL